MNIKKMMAMALAAMLATVLEAAVGVKNVTCQQRYPWNGRVDIDYEVTSDDPNADIWVYPTGYDKDANVSMAPRALTGEGAGAAVKPGKHRMTWDVSADYPDFASTAFSVKMIALTGGAPYMVIDLSGGVDALSYPVSYLSSVPAGGWSDEYKTTKLVLRLIPPGTFMMGSPSDEYGRNSNEYFHKVTLTKPYYIGVFPVTQRQYTLVMGANPSYWQGDLRPVEKVSYVDIRGGVNGVAWPTHNQVDANSFMGRMRSKVNMLFDLPTEAQWEYACRAGTQSPLHNGGSLTDLYRCESATEIAHYYANNTCNVGLFKDNAWGLYDMCGNVKQWCMDVYVDNLGTVAVTDPQGGSASSSASRVVRGNACRTHSYDDYTGYSRGCRSANRGSCSPTSAAWNDWSGYSDSGFRIACSPAAH